MKVRKVLLYLGKFPGYGFDVDGGSILARRLIDMLKNKCYLDVVFIRKNNEEYFDKQVNSVRYVQYIDAKNNKFVRRLENLQTNREAIGDYHIYDTIITAHVSKFFGLEQEPKDFWDKTILFPMFCTSSYKRAGEYVPSSYTDFENVVLSKVKKIICPSLSEKNDLIRDYNIASSKICVIPRGIPHFFYHANDKSVSSSPQIVYIGSIKPQKNNIDAIKVLNCLRKFGVNAQLHMICTIQDEGIYQNLQKYIISHALRPYVHFHFEQKQEEVADLLHKMDISISVSNWETFGRGIYEGIVSELPTFVYENLTDVRQFCNGNIGVTFVKNHLDMASEINKIIGIPQLYIQKVAALKLLKEKVSYENEERLLLNAILL